MFVYLRGWIFKSSLFSKAYFDRVVNQGHIVRRSWCAGTIYMGGRGLERQSDTKSSTTAVPAHMTVSAPPQ